MLSLDDRAALPETPAFRTDMEQFLVSVARREPRRSWPTRRALIAVAAGGAAVTVAIAAAVASNGTSGAPGRVEAGAVHVHLADFSVDTNPGGTVAVTLSQAQILDPHALRQALAQAGIPARVTPDSVCYNPVPDRSALFEAVAMQKLRPGEASDVVITPSKLPAGSTLAIGYVHPPSAAPGGLAKPFFSLLTAGAPVICSSSPPPVSKEPVPAPPPGSKEPVPAGGGPGPAA
jgi:hypothetical protein